MTPGFWWKWFGIGEPPPAPDSTPDSGGTGVGQLNDAQKADLKDESDEWLRRRRADDPNYDSQFPKDE